MQLAYVLLVRIVSFKTKADNVPRDAGPPLAFPIACGREKAHETRKASHKRGCKVMGRVLRIRAIFGIVGVALIYLFWLSRPDWVDEMRFWRAVGDASLIFLYLALALGPTAKLFPTIGKYLSYRRGRLPFWG